MTDSYVTTQHALPQNISQFETPALPQPAFDQQALTPGTNTDTLSVLQISLMRAVQVVMCVMQKNILSVGLYGKI